MAGTLTIFATASQGILDLAGRVPAVRVRTSAMPARTWLWAGAVGCLSALALVWLAESEHPAPMSVEAISVDEAAAPATLRQDTASIAIVQAVRERPADSATGTPHFETTMRMRDGTLRVSDETGGARWKVGDKVILIGSQPQTLNHQ